MLKFLSKTVVLNIFVETIKHLLKLYSLIISKEHHLIIFFLKRTITYVTQLNIYIYVLFRSFFPHTSNRKLA